MLSGYYEQHNRNFALGAIFLVLIVGAIYSAASDFLTRIVISFSNHYFYSKLQLREQLHDDVAITDEIIKQLVENIASKKYLIWVLKTIFQFAVFLSLTIALSKKWFTECIYEYAGCSNFSLSGIVLGSFLGLLIIPPGILIGTYFYNLFPGIKKLSEVSNALFVTQSKFDMIFWLFTVGLTPAICEEILFRGVFLRTLLRRYSAWVAILISALLFTLFHTSFLNLPSTLLAGLLLGIAYWLYNSIFVSMAVQFFYNAGQILLINNFLGINKYLLNEDGNFHYHIIGTALFLMVIIIILMYVDKKQYTNIVLCKPVVE